VGLVNVLRNVLFDLLKKFRVLPHLIDVIKRKSAGLEMTFDLEGELVAVPCSVGVKKKCPLSPTLFLFIMQALLESLEGVLPADAQLEFIKNIRTKGINGRHVTGTG
jgi:hypothetical protein